MRSLNKSMDMRRFFLTYGFLLVMLVLVVVVGAVTGSFLTASNILGLLHSSAPIMVTAAGLVLLIMAGKIDISIGSVAFVSTAVGTVLMVRYGVSPAVALPLVILIGALCGSFTGFVVVKLRVNPLIASLGMLFALRGVALAVTDGRTISIPESVSAFGSLRIGPVFIDIVIVGLFILSMHVLHRHTTYGRHMMAIGNDAQTAERLGVKTDRVTFIGFVLSGTFASLGGLLSITQLGSVSLNMGLGLEFTAIAMIVIGGISLFGGEGSILPGFVLGVLTLNIIENGLNHLGASPYAYPFVRGGVIFVAMYADTLKYRLRLRGRSTA